MIIKSIKILHPSLTEGDEWRAEYHNISRVIKVINFGNKLDAMAHARGYAVPHTVIDFVDDVEVHETHTPIDGNVGWKVDGRIKL